MSDLGQVFILNMREIVKILNGFEPAHENTDPCMVIELMIRQACLGDLVPWSPDEICASSLFDNYPGMPEYWINRVVYEMNLELDHSLPHGQLQRRAMTLQMTRGFGQTRGLFYVPSVA